MFCWGAGTGIQDSLKNYCPHGLRGSSPLPSKFFLLKCLISLLLTCSNTSALRACLQGILRKFAPRTKAFFFEKFFYSLLFRDEKVGAMFLFEVRGHTGRVPKGKNREPRPCSIFRQENDGRASPFLYFSLKNYFMLLFVCNKNREGKSKLPVPL